ncbi:MAG: LTA synthase family protein [Lautropia sp.]
MLRLTVRFIIAALVVLTLCRIGLALWQAPRVTAAGGVWPVLIGGLRIDASLLAMLVLLPAAAAPWLGHRRWPVALTATWYRCAWLLIVLLEVATPGFIEEYDTRPNRLFVEYLTSPREVGGMLLHGYVGTVAVVLLAMAVAVWLSLRLFPLALRDPPLRWRWRAPATAGLVLLLALAARGTLEHRPLNPSVVAFAADAMVNTLPLNSLYGVAHAVYRTRSERSSQAAYGTLPADEIQSRVLAAAGLPAPPAGVLLPSVHAQQASMRRQRPLNLVIIVEESLGAQFVGHLGGSGLTPQLDRLAADAWTFRNAYATGTRSARGLEAITTGFPPTPSESVLKLPLAQSGFFTLAELLDRHGYRSRFVYGGEAHFDNMKAFFLGNGFDEVIDRDRFEAPQFVGTWGASDDDMFRQVDRLLRQPGTQPTLTVAFTVSNHTPWEFPAGRIPVTGQPGRDDAVRYADRALGDFFDTARRAPYWRDTVFLIVADHDARAGGATLVPLWNFRIPALILGADIAPRQDNRLISQIDLAPTLLSLIGIDSEHPMLGADLTVRSPDRALMQYTDNYGYLAGDRLIVLEPGKPARQFTASAHPGAPPQQALQPAAVDPELARTALAHALWPEWAYRNRRYRLPPLP